MPSDKPNWKLILIVLVAVALTAAGAAVLTAEHVPMEFVLVLALIAVAGSFLLNWYVGGTKKNDNDHDSPDKPA
ncbi:MAG: hypothetical protein GY835_18215 [bacterium]|nr:hypothetical protein [bacterium]